MEFAVDGANILLKMEGIIKDNGEIAKCTGMENYTINHKNSHMMEIGFKANFQERGISITNILENLRFLSSNVIYLWCRISGLIIKVQI